MEKLLILYLCFTHSTWARRWTLCLPQVWTLFLGAFAWWRLRNCSSIIHFGKNILRNIFTCSLSSNERQYSNILSFWDAYIEHALCLDQHLSFLCLDQPLSFLCLHYDDVFKVTWMLTQSCTSRQTLHSSTLSLLFFGLHREPHLGHHLIFFILFHNLLTRTLISSLDCMHQAMVNHGSHKRQSWHRLRSISWTLILLSYSRDLDPSCLNS
jgi:hypothetical protein